MKKICSVIPLSILLLLLLNSCAADNNEPVINEYIRHDKNAVIELTGGWYFFCDYEEIYNTDGSYETTYCTIDGMNLKYQNLSDFNIAITDKQSGKITGYVTPAVHGFCMNKLYKEKLEELSEYVKNRNASADLTVEELDFSDIPDMLFTKDDVVKVYNSAMTKGTVNPGKYMYISSSDIIKGPALGNYYWQVGYLILSGNISAINIELIYSDGRRLSDIDISERTEAQSELLKAIKQAQESIINRQSFTETGFQFNKTVSDVDFNRLFTILTAIEEKNETNRKNAS